MDMGLSLSLIFGIILGADSSRAVVFVLCLFNPTRAHSLGRSLHEVFCADNTRFAVVVCIRLAFPSYEIRFYFVNLGV